MADTIERRRFRRAELDAPVSLRSLEKDEFEMPVTGRIKDISLAGVYCYVASPCPLKIGERIICSVRIPMDLARLFPFRHVLGKGWVARIEPVLMGRREGETPSTSTEQRLGVAVAFTSDVTALGTID